MTNIAVSNPFNPATRKRVVRVAFPAVAACSVVVVDRTVRVSSRGASMNAQQADTLSRTMAAARFLVSTSGRDSMTLKTAAFILQGGDSDEAVGVIDAREGVTS